MADDPNEDDSWLYGNPEDTADTAAAAAAGTDNAANGATTTTTPPPAEEATHPHVEDIDPTDEHFVEADDQTAVSEEDHLAHLRSPSPGQRAAAAEAAAAQYDDDEAAGADGGSGQPRRSPKSGSQSPANEKSGGGGGERREQRDDMFEGSDVDDDDDDDEINVVIGEIKADKSGQNYNIKQRPSLLGPGGPTAVVPGGGAGGLAGGEATKPKQAPGRFSIDEFESVGTIAGVPAHEFSIDSLEEKPWRKPGADITDYFNYGFNEDTWRAYCERQKQMRLNESGVGLQGLSVGIPATVKNEWRERMMGERRNAQLMAQQQQQQQQQQHPHHQGQHQMQQQHQQHQQQQQGGGVEGEFGGNSGGFRTDGFIRRAGPPPGRKVMGQIDVIGGGGSGNGMHGRRDQDGPGGVGIGVIGGGNGPLIKGLPMPTKENVIQVMTAERREYSRIQGAFPTPVNSHNQPFFEPEPNYNYGYEPTQEQQWDNSDQPPSGWQPTGIKELTSGPGQPIVAMSGAHHSMRSTPGTGGGGGGRGDRGLLDGGGGGGRDRDRERDRDRQERMARDYGGGERLRDRVKSEDRRERDRGAERSSRRGGGAAEGSSSSATTRDRSRSRERRRRSKSREKEREKEREKDRDKEREKDRDKDKDKDRKKERDEDKEKKKDKEKEKEKEKEKDKEKDKDRDEDRKSRDRKKSHKKDKEIKEERVSD